MLKCSIRKRLKKEIANFYPTLLPEHLEDLLPSYIPLFVVRLVTYGGVIVTTYHADGEPLFFEHGVRLLPSGKANILSLLIPCCKIFSYWWSACFDSMLPLYSLKIHEQWVTRTFHCWVEGVASKITKKASTRLTRLSVMAMIQWTSELPLIRTPKMWPPV